MVALVCIFLMINGIGHFCMDLFSICTYSSEKCLFGSFAHFKIICFLAGEFLDSLIHFGHEVLPTRVLAGIFPLPWLASFAGQKLFSLM